MFPSLMRSNQVMVPELAKPPVWVDMYISPTSPVGKVRSLLPIVSPATFKIKGLSNTCCCYHDYL